MKIQFGHLLSLILLCADNTVHARSLDGVYQVEIIVFERPQRADGSGQEKSPTHIELAYPDNQLMLLDAAHADATTSESTRGAPLNTFLAPSFRGLEDKKNALQRRGFRILFHQTWFQALMPTVKAPALPIIGGKKFGSHNELEGYLTLSLSNYIVVESNLWLTEFVPYSVQTVERWPQLPNPKSKTSLNPESAETNVDANRPLYLINNISILKHQRKLRSSELHYFDHPKMGMLIKVTPPAAKE